MSTQLSNIHLYGRAGFIVRNFLNADPSPSHHNASRVATGSRRIPIYGARTGSSAGQSTEPLIVLSVLQCTDSPMAKHPSAGFPLVERKVHQLQDTDLDPLSPCRNPERNAVGRRGLAIRLQHPSGSRPDPQAASETPTPPAILQFWARSLTT